MVETRACFATTPWWEVLAFLTGEAAVDPKLITPELWAKLLRRAAEMVPFGDLQNQTQSLRQILAPERHNEKRRTDAAGPTLWDAVKKAGFGKAVGFFSCSENVLMSEDYRTAPRKVPTEGMIGSPGLADIEDSILVVPVFGKKNPRRKEVHFLRVDTTWSPKEQEGGHHYPEFWYQLSAIWIKDLDDTGLGEFAARPHMSNNNKAMEALWHLESGVSTWRDGLSSEVRHATKIAHTLRGMYRKAGGIDLWD